MRSPTVRSMAILGIITLSLFPAYTIAQHVIPECCNYPAKPGGIKIQFLLEACAFQGGGEKGMIPYFDCQSYVLGVVDSYRLLRDSVAKEKRTCIPENVTTRDILELIWNAYPNWDIPESRGAADVILEVLKKRYPCTK
jgi:Rap1a immunity proteins